MDSVPTLAAAQMCGGEPAGMANLLRRDFPPILKIRLKGTRHHLHMVTHPLPQFQKPGILTLK